MPDMEKIIEGLEHCSKGPIGCQTNCPYQRDFGCRAQLTADALALLKEREWHVFHERELDEEEKQEHPEWNWIMDVDCTPGNGEEFLHYRKCNGSINITTWDDDLWAEYCDTGDCDPIEDGDAWMELPKPPSK